MTQKHGDAQVTVILHGNIYNNDHSSVHMMTIIHVSGTHG